MAKLDWKYTPKDKTAPSEQEIPEETPESFASRHVKVITFLVCMAVLFLVFGPIGFLHWHEMGKVDKMGDKPMTEAALAALSRKGTALTLSDLTNYKGEMTENDERRVYTIKFDDYHLLCIETKATGKLDFCTLTHLPCGASLEVMTSDVTIFFTEHQTK